MIQTVAVGEGAYGLQDVPTSLEVKSDGKHMKIMSLLKTPEGYADISVSQPSDMMHKT